MTNLTMLTADEWAGNLFAHFVLAQLPSGAAALKPAFERERERTDDCKRKAQKDKKDKNNKTAEIMPSAKLTLQNFIRVTEDLLSFHEWLKRGHPLMWNDCIEMVCKDHVKRPMIVTMMHFPREAGNG